MRIYILFILGINTLLINNAETYVMFTANIADLKRLAAKIVPREIVENVVRVLDDMMKTSNTTLRKTRSFENAKLSTTDNISKENLKYQDDVTLKEEESKPTKKNGLDKRQKAKENTHKTKKRNKYPKKYIKPDIFPEKIVDKLNRVTKLIEDESVANESDENNSDKQTKSSEIQTKQTSPIANDDIEPTTQYKEEKDDNTEEEKDDNSKSSAEVKDNEDGNTKSNKEGGKRPEELEQIYDDLEEAESIDEESFRRGALTTARERNEFDQYFNYLPKFDYAVI